MTNDEYRQLIAFLGTKFTEVDAQFQALESGLVGVRREIGDVQRGLRVEIQQLRDDIDQRFEHFQGRMQAVFDEVKGLVRLSYADLDRRVRRIEDRP